jgi:LmbE family N-acetylglucosaminyl deacetylase
MKRFAIAFLFLSLISQASPQKNILLIFPHPDDETMIRSVIMRLVEAGNSVSAIYLTRGEGGSDRKGNQTPEQLAQTRTTELENAAKLYGYKHLYQLKNPDNPLRDPATHIPSRDATQFLNPKGPWDVAQIKNDIEKIARTEQPDIVITFFPDQPGTHAHHRATAALVERQYEDPVVSGASMKVAVGKQCIEFSPRLLSMPSGPYHGKAYGEVGTDAALAHVSQLKGDTGKFIKNWKENPSEVLAPIHSPHGLTPLIEALGDVKGMKILEASCDQALTK